MKLHSELRVSMFSGHFSCGLWTKLVCYGRLRLFAESPIVSMTVGGQKHCRSFLIRATEQADVVRSIKGTIRPESSALLPGFRCRRFDICNAPCRIPLPTIFEIDSSGHSHGTTRRCIVSVVIAQLLTRLLVGRLNATLEYSTLEYICPIGCNIQ